MELMIGRVSIFKILALINPHCLNDCCESQVDVIIFNFAKKL